VKRLTSAVHSTQIVFLHELGHLQMIDETRPSALVPFSHPDPVHNPPGAEELSANEASA
jgi:hypothetical protein